MTDWVERMAAVRVGDRVAYAKQWLQGTGQYTGDAPFARGTVTAVEPMGSTQLAVVKWDAPDLPDRVNVRNLSRVVDGVVRDRD